MTPHRLIQHGVEFLNLKFEYLRENESFTKTILACLSLSRGDRFMQKNVKKSLDTVTLSEILQIAEFSKSSRFGVHYLIQWGLWKVWLLKCLEHAPEGNVFLDFFKTKNEEKLQNCIDHFKNSCAHFGGLKNIQKCLIFLLAIFLWFF